MTNSLCCFLLPWEASELFPISSYISSFLLGQFSAFPLWSEGSEGALVTHLEIPECRTASLCFLLWQRVLGVGRGMLAVDKPCVIQRVLLQIRVSVQPLSRGAVIHSCLLFLLLALKKSKRSAYESGEEHSAKYSNSNNSGNYREESSLLHCYVNVVCFVAVIFWLKRSRVTSSLDINVVLNPIPLFWVFNNRYIEGFKILSVLDFQLPNTKQCVLSSVPHS